MLLPKNISPDECIYYRATFVIKALLDKEAMTVTELYYEVNERCRMSFFVLTLCLDWLFLIGCIKFADDSPASVNIRRIKLCI